MRNCASKACCRRDLAMVSMRPMSSPHEELSNAVSSTCQRQAAARWWTISAHLGVPALRDFLTFGAIPDLPREPHAPGSQPNPGREFLASTTVEIDMNLADTHPDNAEAIASSLIDQAGYRLEESVRASLRGRARRGDQPLVPPALDIQDGDRIYAASLVGCREGVPIRYRITQLPGSAKIRIDFELLLALASRDEMVAGLSTRLFPAVAPLVRSAIALEGEQPFRVLESGGTVDGRQMVVLVGIGRWGSARVQESGRLIRETIGQTDEQDMRDDG